MKQILHILRKDARHHWPEELASLILLIAYMAYQPYQWVHQDPTTSRMIAFAVNTMPVLLVVSWALIVTRLVHSESLIGDRQFWLTRPYEWPKLLAAKILSIVFFIHVPLFLAQVFLLAYGRFPVAASIPGILQVHLGTVVVILLPVFAIATVTAGLGSATLSVFAVVLLVAALAAYSSVLDIDLSSTHTIDNIQEALFVGCCVAAVLQQYAKRKKWWSRSWLVACAIVVAALIFVAPYTEVIERAYPLATAEKPGGAQLAFDETLFFDHQKGRPLSYSPDSLAVEFPLLVSKVENDSVVHARAVKLDIETPTGEKWTSHWQSSALTILNGQRRVWLSLAMKRTVFDRFKSTSVKAHLSLALDTYRKSRTTEVQVKSSGFGIPGDGGARCVTSQRDGALHCFAAVREPGPVSITADLPTPECRNERTDSTGPFANLPAYYVSWSDGSGGDFLLSPIIQFTIAVSKLQIMEDESVFAAICPDTSLTFSDVRFEYGNRVVVNLGEVDIKDYVPSYPRMIRKRSKTSDALPPDTQTLIFNLFFGDGD